MDETFKLPRLFTKQALTDQGVIELESGQAHYLHTVMRRKDGDAVRLFNAKNGEWLGILDELGKKSGTVVLKQQIAPQPVDTKRISLIFAPIKKHRMEWVIEKAVELGVTDFYPALTQNTEIRKINTTRFQQQIFEAAEQCERFDIPVLHDINKLDEILNGWPKGIPVFSCLERYETKPAMAQANDFAFVIGPEGGFTKDEKEKIAAVTTPISLGDTVLRSETAMIKALVLLNA